MCSIQNMARFNMLLKVIVTVYLLPLALKFINNLVSFFVIKLQLFHTNFFLAQKDTFTFGQLVNKIY